MLRITQLLVDLYGCEADLDDEGLLLDALERASEAVGSTIMRRITQRFTPVGVSVILILAETHLSVHTWPEHGYAAVDVFICGEGKDPNVAWEAVRETLRPESFDAKEITRTIGESRK